MLKTVVLCIKKNPAAQALEAYLTRWWAGSKICMEMQQKDWPKQLWIGTNFREYLRLVMKLQGWGQCSTGVSSAEEVSGPGTQSRNNRYIDRQLIFWHSYKVNSPEVPESFKELLLDIHLLFIFLCWGLILGPFLL